MSELQSKTIDWLRLVLVMMVIAIHVHPDHSQHYLGMDGLENGTFLQAAYTVAVSALFVVCNVSVPLFFFISGYLFFTGDREWSIAVYREKLRKRIFTLLIPYLTYNLLCAANGWLMPLADPDFQVHWQNPDALPVIGEFWNSTTFCVGWKNILGFDMQLYYPADVPLWFVRDLMVTVLLTPAIHFFIRKCPALYIGVLGLMYISGFGACAPGLSTNALFFFSLGAAFSIRHPDIIAFTRRHRTVLMTLSGILLVCSTIWYAAPFAQQLHNSFYICALLTTFDTGAELLEKGKTHIWDLAVKASFLIFALHCMPIGNGSILQLCGRISTMLFNTQTVAGAVLGYMSAAVLTAGICILVYYILSRTAPRMLRVLSGGR